MLVREIKAFRDQVAMPRLQELLDNTKISEGMCCIDQLDISFLDGRSCGTDYYIKASGLLYENGTVKEYSYEQEDVSVAEFAAEHKDCAFIAEGALSVWDELSETEINSRIGQLGFCAQMFSELSQANILNIKSNCIEFLKIQTLHEPQAVSRPSLSNQIKSAETKTAAYPQHDGSALKINSEANHTSSNRLTKASLPER